MYKKGYECILNALLMLSVVKVVLIRNVNMCMLNKRTHMFIFTLFVYTVVVVIIVVDVVVVYDPSLPYSNSFLTAPFTLEVP